MRKRKGEWKKTGVNAVRQRQLLQQRWNYENKARLPGQFRAALRNNKIYWKAATQLQVALVEFSILGFENENAGLDGVLKPQGNIGKSSKSLEEINMRINREVLGTEEASAAAT